MHKKNSRRRGRKQTEPHTQPRKKQRPAATPEAAPDDGAVSMRSSDMVPAQHRREDADPPDLADVRGFKVKGTHEDVLPTIELPLYCRRALATVGYVAGRPLSHVALWAIERGLRRLWFGDVRDICNARNVLLACGSIHIAQIEKWTYRPQAREGSKGLTVRQVAKTDRNLVIGRAEGLGLSASAVGVLAILFGLADAPALPENLAFQLAGEVREFCEAVRQRAVIARAAPLPQPPPFPTSGTANRQVLCSAKFMCNK